MSSNEVMVGVAEFVKEYKDFRKKHAELVKKHAELEKQNAKLKRKFKETSMELDRLKKSKKESEDDLPPSLFNKTTWDREKKRVQKFSYSASTDDSRVKGRAVPIKYFICLVSKLYISVECFVWYEDGWKLEYTDPTNPLHKIKILSKYDWKIALPLYRAFLTYLIKYRKKIKCGPHRLPSVIWLEDFVSIIDCDTDPED